MIRRQVRKLVCNFRHELRCVGLGDQVVRNDDQTSVFELCVSIDFHYRIGVIPGETLEIHNRVQSNVEPVLTRILNRKRLDRSPIVVCQVEGRFNQSVLKCLGHVMGVKVSPVANWETNPLGRSRALS